MKKVMAALIAAALVFSPVGTVVFQDHSTTVEAKSYKSGKRSFNNSTNSNSGSFFQNKKADTTNKSATTSPTKKSFSSGSLMKGLMLGGLAGFLFGSLLGNLGFLGSIIGLFVNILAIMLLISIIRRLFAFFKEKRRKEEYTQWRS